MIKKDTTVLAAAGTHPAGLGQCIGGVELPMQPTKHLAQVATALLQLHMRTVCCIV